MTQRSSAKPILFTALASALLLTPACGDDSEGNDMPSTSGMDTDPNPTTGTTTGTPEGSTTTDDTTGDATVTQTGTTAPQESSSSSGEPGEDTGSTSGGQAIGYADILGTYIDDFSGVHTIEADTWTQEYPDSTPLMFSVEQVDDDARWVVMGEGEAGTFARFDWDFDDDGNLRFCQGTFGQGTIEDAAAAPDSDREDFDGVGCGGMFAWSLLAEK